VLGDRAHEIVIVADGPKHLYSLTDEITAAIARDDLVVEPWQEFAKSFYEAMKTDQSGNWISIFIIMLVVSVGVLNTILMSVLERRREYGLLKAIGTSPRGVFRLVLYEVFVMACVSVAIGLLVSLGINHWLTTHGVTLPEELSFAGVEFQEMYAEINVRSYVIPAIVVLFSSMFVAIFPAIRASRTTPASAMRTV
jgi:ABC-type lipoprotein release transport system permease subunit